MTINDIRRIAAEAGDAIMKTYDGPAQVETKEDDSPLTQADRAAHECIVAALTALTPDIPVLSEESEGISTEERLSWNRFWLVDPLDGTKEFIKKTGQFTVNIALIENGEATLGVVLAPCLVVVLIAALNSDVTTTELYSGGIWVFALTAVLALVGFLARNKQKVLADTSL